MNEQLYIEYSVFKEVNYCRTANFHVLVILTNEKNSIKLQLLKVSSQNCQKQNWAIIDEIWIKSGDTNRPA